MRTRLLRSPSDPVPSGHVPVLLHETIDSLAIEKSDVVVDATLGGAGHAREIADRLGSGGMFVGFDLDHDAIARAQDSLKDAKCNVHLVEASFRTLGAELEKLGIVKIDKALFDLGWSGFQLDAGRGFSFQKDEPLLMTYSKDPKALTARTIVNEWGEESLADVIYGWGEERYSRRIAKAIVKARTKKSIETSRELGELVKASVPSGYRFGRIHPATKTFQALRIAVNDELGALKDGLRGAWEKLSVGGRIAVITFHSIEDREVKRSFQAWEKEGSLKRVAKKPIVASAEEIKTNPRARSAKLRAVEKVK
jgi:16S rRNA (cytosine1402-N4)-methyltransferase